MHEQIAEAFMAVDSPPAVASQVCARINEFCQSSVWHGLESHLDFEDGRAIIRPVGNGLLFWVAARNIVMFHAIQTLLQGGVLNITRRSDQVLHWHTATGKPFETLQRAGNGCSEKCPSSHGAH